MTPKKPKTTPKTSAAKTAVETQADKDYVHRKAKAHLSPDISATGIVRAYSSEPELDHLELVHVMRDCNKAVAEGDMRRVEAMLLGQAHALQSMFADLAYCAKHQTGLAAIQTIMGLALKAQHNAGQRCKPCLT